jgi:hypothetical protein
MKNKPPNIYEYVNVLKEHDPVFYYPKKKRKRFFDISIWKIRLNLLKDDWKYSIKPMFITFNPFDFKSRINNFGDKETPFSRFKELVLGVYYILKSTFTYLPLGYK